MNFVGVVIYSHASCFIIVILLLSISINMPTYWSFFSWETKEYIWSIALWHLADNI